MIFLLVFLLENLVWYIRLVVFLFRSCFRFVFEKEFEVWFSEKKTLDNQCMAVTASQLLIFFKIIACIVFSLIFKDLFHTCPRRVCHLMPLCFECNFTCLFIS